ncbi:MAG: ornithine cyclodeaminase family protein [Canibacter sp.]
MNLPTYLDASAIAAALSPSDAVAAITETLRSGYDPVNDIPRSTVPTSRGHFLLMPTEAGHMAGVKVATVAPANPATNLPRIQGTYLLFDSATLSLQAILDGTVLTTVRTPAVSVAAVQHRIRRSTASLKVAVVGAGPQAVAHVDTLAAIVLAPFTTVNFLVRNPSRVSSDVHERGSVHHLGSISASDAIADADIIVCATSAHEPLFAGDLVKSSATVIAVGSHEPDKRELGSSLIARSSIIVEDRQTALREAGDIVIPHMEDAITETDLIPMKNVVTGEIKLSDDRPAVFKSVGMSWEDLAVAQAAFHRSRPEK